MMNKDAIRQPKLKILEGRLSCETSCGSLRVIAAPKMSPPCTPQAFVFEEDTFLVLSADKTVREPKESLIHMMTRLIEIKPQSPGDVIVMEGMPLKFLAVVHDLNQEPSWKENWVGEAIHNIFIESETRNFQSIAMQMVGTVHGSMTSETFAELLAKALDRIQLQHLKLLWLIVPRGKAHQVIKSLRDFI